MKMGLAMASLLMGIAPISSYAASPTPTVGDVRAVTPLHVVPQGLVVHYLDGQRFDVPDGLLRDRSTLLNGLPPQPLQFD